MAYFRNSPLFRILLLVLAVLLVASACGSDDAATTAGEGAATTVAEDGADAGGPDTETGDEDESLPRFAMVLPGTIQDATYNAAGFGALQYVAEEYSLETEYSETVAVVDVERVTRDYLDRGFEVVSLHGGQFLTAGLELAPEYPDSVIIVQSGGPLEDAPDNVWNIGRPYHEGYFALGALAAEVSQTSVVAFLGGLEIPLIKSSANAFIEGARHVDPQIDIVTTFSGDQSDAVTNRQAAEALISSGADVIVTSINDGIAGVAEAASRADGQVLFTSLTSDQSDIAPEHYLAGLITDFNVVYGSVVESIMDGETGGYIAQELGQGQELTAIYNVEDENVEGRIQELVQEIEAGDLEVADNPGDVTVPEKG